MFYQIHTIAIIAEGIPEALTRKLIKTADEKGVTIIGPATVNSLIRRIKAALHWLRPKSHKGLGPICSIFVPDCT